MNTISSPDRSRATYSASNHNTMLVDHQSIVPNMYGFNPSTHGTMMTNQGSPPLQMDRRRDMMNPVMEQVSSENSSPMKLNEYGTTTATKRRSLLSNHDFSQKNY